jgi:hypothetical protein
MIEDARSHTAQVDGVGPLQVVQPLISEYDIDPTPILGTTPPLHQAVGDKLVDQPRCPTAREIGAVGEFGYPQRAAWSLG